MVQFILIFLFLSSLAWAEPDESNGAPKPKEFHALNPEMRLKLWELSELPPDQLQAELAKWPRYQKMKPEKQAQLIARMQEMRTHMHDMAMAKAKEYGLQIPPGTEDDFAKKYIQRRMEEEKKIWEQMKPMREKMEETLKEEMLQQYGGK